MSTSPQDFVREEDYSLKMQVMSDVESTYEYDDDDDYDYEDDHDHDHEKDYDDGETPITIICQKVKLSHSVRQRETERQLVTFCLWRRCK